MRADVVKIRERITMLELLAPGGSFEGMKAAVNAGADAIYMGGTKFGARAYAQNPEEKNLLAAMDYCHLHERKLYLTVNTLLKEAELEKELYEYLLPLYEHGLDAVLVQDLGVFQFIQKHFPQLPLHASTQMTITGVEGARLLKSLGAERIVPSRELSVKELEQIHREVDIEIECFVHGALCYCYSGQCLMSSLIGGRSGNRGRCAQPCRLPYDLYREGVRQNTEKERYLLSLKDICTLQSLPELIEAGVCSFKIEGRMKRAEYAAGVVEVYRKYLDLYRTNGREGYRVDPEDERILMDLYNRGGFSGGYYKTWNSKEMMAMERPNHWGTPAAKVVSVKNGQIRLKALEDLWAKDALEIGTAAEDENTAKTGGQGPKGKLQSNVKGRDKEVQMGPRELILKENIPAGEEFVLSVNPKLVKNGQVLARVRCEKLLQRLQETYLKKEIQEKIKGNFILKWENPAILTVRWKEKQVTVTGEMAMAASNRPMDVDTVRRQLSKTGNTPFAFETLEIQVGENLFYPMQSLNELRRNALEQLQQAILEEYRRNLAEDKTIGEKEQLLEQGAESSGQNPEFQLRASVETFEQLEEILKQPSIYGVYLDCCMFMWADGENAKKKRGQKQMTFAGVVQALHEKRKKCYLTLPMIWRDRVEKAFEGTFSVEDLELADGFLLRSSEQLEYMRRILAEFVTEKEMIADAGVYTYNKSARTFMKTLGITRDTLPLECNRRELQQRGCEGSEAIVYGYLPLMVTAQCLAKNTSGCKHTPGVWKLKDRKNAEFPVRNQCSICTNIIYNSLPLDLISSGSEILELHPASCRLAFTFETREEVGRLVQAAESCFLKGRELARVVNSGTRGHFKRGVE